MFFTRLRRRAKWVFLALAIVFALGFVGFGVGAQGNGIGDYIRDLVGLGSSSSSGAPSIAEARAKVEENPNDAQAHRDLATALQTSGQLAAAIPELERYLTFKANDVDALQQLASLYGARADQQRRDLATANAEASGSTFAGELPTGSLADQLTGGPITTLELDESTSRVNTLVSETQSTYSKQADAYRRLADLQPNEPANYLQLGQAAFFGGNTAQAITAWKQFLRLAPDDPNAPLIKRQLRLLEKSSGSGQPPTP